MVYVEDVDQAFATALGAGATRSAPSRTSSTAIARGGSRTRSGTVGTLPATSRTCPPAEMEKRAAEAMSGG